LGGWGQGPENGAPGAGAEIGNAQFSRARAAGIDCRECSLDDRFRLRPWHQRRGIDAQRQAPEFLIAENARDRLAGEAASSQSGDGAVLVRTNLASCASVVGPP